MKTKEKTANISLTKRFCPSNINIIIYYLLKVTHKEYGIIIETLILHDCMDNVS